jgi:ADP-ribose pyrophosphatase YjhB (NUDIX family)
MSVRQPSGEVSAYLESLYEEFEGFDVAQTTVGVDPEDFATVAERGDVAEVRVSVEGNDGLLAVPGDDEWARPGGVVAGGLALAAPPEDIVRRQTGVDCAVEELRRVSLVCLQCEATGDQVWELRALFGAEAGAGTPAADAAWREELPDPSAGL